MSRAVHVTCHFCRYTRGLTKVYRNVYVCTGPLYLPKVDPADGKSYVRFQVIGQNNVAVPTHFFKVIVGETESSRDLEMEAYVMPNEKIPDHVPIHTFQVLLMISNVYQRFKEEDILLD